MPYCIDNKDGTRTWYAYVTFNGKRIRRKAGAQRRQAIEIESELRAKYRKGEFNPFEKPRDPYFEEFVEKYLKWSKTNKRSYQRDCQLVDNLRRWFGGIKLSAINPGDIETFKIERKTERARSWSQRFISNATVNREVACLKRMFNLAIEWNDVHRNPVKNIKMLQEAKKQERYIDGDEFSKLYEAASPTIRPVLLLAYHTGMRSSEFLNLQWRQVKIFDPPLPMVGNIQNYGYIQLVRTKSGKVREIPLNHTIWDYLD